MGTKSSSSSEEETLTPNTRQRKSRGENSYASPSGPRVDSPLTQSQVASGLYEMNYLKNLLPRSGFRLVQRKFAQGVPIPVSSSPAAPAPPEKKTDPPCPPRSVYHNNMSARSLLDIVALQNLHRHKQEPLVLLKRLREDEIQSAFSSLSKLPTRKRRGLKADKNKMALRSGKRKSPEAPKFAIKRRKKKSSESTDDVPLAFYDAQKRKEALANKTKLAKRLRARPEEKTEKRTPNGQESRAVEKRKPDETRTRGTAVLRLERKAPSRQNTREEGSKSDEARTPVIERGPLQRRDRKVPSRQDSTEERRKSDEARTPVIERGPALQRRDRKVPSRQDSTEERRKSDEARTPVIERGPALQRRDRKVPSRQDSTEERRKSDEARTPVIERGPALQRRDRKVPSRQDSTEGRKSDEARTPVIERGPKLQRRDRKVPSRQDSTGSNSDEVQTARRVPAAQNKWNDNIMCEVNNSPSNQDADLEDGSFAFKEPRNPVRLSYRRFREQRAAAAAKGRPLKKIVRPTSEVRSSPRTTASQRSPSEEPGVAKRLRNKLVLTVKSSTAAARESAVPTPTTVEPSPSPSPEPPKSDVSECASGGITRRLNTVVAGAVTTLNVDMSTPTSEIFDDVSNADSYRSDWCIPNDVEDDIDKHSLQTEGLDLEITDVKPVALLPEIQDKRDTVNPQSSLEEESVRDNQSSQSNESKRDNPKSSQSNYSIRGNPTSSQSNDSIREIRENPKRSQSNKSTRDNPPNSQSIDIRDNSQSSQNESIRDNPQSSQSNESIRSSTEQYADSELETLNVLKQKMLKRNSEKDAKGSEKKRNSLEPRQAEVEKRSSRSNQKQAGKKIQKRKEKQAATKPNNVLKKITRGSKTPREVTTRLTRNTTESPQAPAACDVYEFDAEREASGPPSGLRARRTQATQPTPEHTQTPPTLGDKHRELLEFFASQKAQKRVSSTNTTRDVISDEKKRALIENLSSSPSLLDKFLNYLSPEIQTELDKLIAAEQKSGEHKMTDVKNEYLDPKTGSLMEALTFYPTEEEFADPILYFEKIAPQASVHGLCKIVPPAGFKPPCNISDTIRFAVIYQYISKMYSRWGPVTRELAAIKAHLRTQSVMFARSPLLDGSEVNLPKLYHVVERHGGLNNVMQRKRWGRVADEMKLTKLQHPERKLDPLYMRYLLPYATLSDKERQTIMSEVEKYWTLKYQKMLKRARNPFQRQARMLSAETENESSDDERDETSTAGALREAEDCIVPGRTMNLATFKKIATTLMDAHFEPKSQPPNPIEVEKAYWRAVLLGTEHIVANTASIDTGEEGYGFPKDPGAEYGADPWNLKVLARNPNNVLRYLGQVLGVTVPTLHLNMLFSTSCWHRDPHGLPWIEYMHSGAEKIWYGIPRDESANFRRAVETLCPAYCQNKSIWLASEITMIPPNILSEHEVRLCRLIQRPGEYVLVFPEAHSCSITTGFGISESVYFASNTWLCDVYKLFQELRNSCEPTMFSLEQLLLNGSKDDAAPSQVCTVLSTLLGAELEHRRALERKGLEVQERPASGAPLNTSYFRAWHARDHDDECEYCRCTLYLSKVIGLTGRNSAVCPEHALRLLETRRHRNVDIATLEFLSSYSTRSIEEMMERLEASSGDTELIDLTTPVPMDEMDPQPSTSRQARSC